MAHICNPSFSGGSDQEDSSLRPAQAKTQDPLLKINKAKRAEGDAQV
jgi:hypothetical protein